MGSALVARSSVDLSDEGSCHGSTVGVESAGGIVGHVGETEGWLGGYPGLKQLVRNSHSAHPGIRC
jgi:hypothetical protein